MARLGLRIIFIIVALSTTLLFYTGYHLQQQSISAIRGVLPSPAPPPPSPAPPSTIPPHLLRAARLKRTAYIATITSPSELCNAVILFASLHRTRSGASRILHYPTAWDTERSHSRTTRRLMEGLKARYAVQAKPVEKPGFGSVLAETEMDRVLWLDSLGILQRNFDGDLIAGAEHEDDVITAAGGDRKTVGGGAVLGSGGAASGSGAPTIAVVRDPTDPAAGKLWSGWVLLKPSLPVSQTVQHRLDKGLTAGEVLTELYSQRAEIRSWFPIILHIQQIRNRCRECWDGSGWDVEKVLRESRYVSFRDDEVKDVNRVLVGREREAVLPKGESEREVWLRLRDRWAKERAEVCGLDLIG